MFFLTVLITQLNKSILALLAALLLTALVSPTSVQAETSVNNYYTRFTPEGRRSVGAKGTYQKDNHVWVYTSEFAKRFGMPEKWIDDELEGAEALAYRIDLDLYGVKCGYFGEQETCFPSKACIMDMYIDDSTNLPWNTERRFDSLYGSKSLNVLIPQNTNDQPSHIERAIKRGQQYKRGLDLTTVVYGEDDQWRLGAYTIWEYDRDIYKGLDYLSGSVNCSFGEYRDIKINIYEAVFRKNGSVAGKSLENLHHQVKIPNSFLQRAESHNKVYYEPNGLFEEVRNRLTTTTKNKQEN